MFNVESFFCVRLKRFVVLQDIKSNLWVVDALPLAQTVGRESVVAAVGDVTRNSSYSLSADPSHLLNISFVGYF